MRSKLLPAVLAAALGVSFAAPGHADDSLFESLGGKTGVERISGRVVRGYMADPRLHAYFDNINPDWLTPRFVTFICNVTGGPCVYRGRSMAAAHRGLHVDEAAFDAVVEDLQAAMRDEGVPFWTQNRLLARLAPMERAIVTR